MRTRLPAQARRRYSDDACIRARIEAARCIVSAPHECEVVIATRMRDSAYKRAPAGLRPGAAVQLDGPFGELVLDPSGLVAAASMALDDLGVREDDVHSEAFEGY